MVVLNGIGKLLSVRILLRREDNCFSALYLINFIYSMVEQRYVIVALGIKSKQVGLNGGVRHHPHQDNARAFIINVGAIDAA